MLWLMQGFEQLSNGLATLSTIAESFKSKGIPILLLSVPNVSDLLETVTGMYTDDAGELAIPFKGSHADGIV